MPRCVAATNRLLGMSQCHPRPTRQAGGYHGRSAKVLGDEGRCRPATGHGGEVSRHRRKLKRRPGRPGAVPGADRHQDARRWAAGDRDVRARLLGNWLDVSPTPTRTPGRRPSPPPIDRSGRMMMDAAGEVLIFKQMCSSRPSLASRGCRPSRLLAFAAARIKVPPTGHAFKALRGQRRRRLIQPNAPRTQRR